MPFTDIDIDIHRSGLGAKWIMPADDVLAAWVADMDFGVPPAVRDRLIEVVSREDLGYSFWPEGDPVITAFYERMVSRHSWLPIPERARLFTDLIQALQVTVELATEPGDGIAVHVPCYPPFLSSITAAGRRIVPIELTRTAEGWTESEEDLAERLRAEGVKLIVIVNPHNPTGRVFTRDELTRIAEAAADIDAVVFSDEIHSDLIYEPHTHIPFASLSDDAASRTVTGTSASKAFNIASMRCAVAHIGAESIWQKLAAQPSGLYGNVSTLSRVAQFAAWTESEGWHEELMLVLARNRDTVAVWAAEHGIGHSSPEATYLAWLDFSGTALAESAGDDEIATVIEERVRVRLNPGSDFSGGVDVDTHKWARLNFATSPDNLAEILRRLEELL